MGLVTELRRRNVIRVAIAYAIAAWLLIEVSATTFPMLKLPEWTATFVTVLVLIGFPLALIFAWAFELTPEGIKREHEVDRSESITQVTGRKLDFIIIGIMAIAIAYFLADKFSWVGDEPATTVAVSEERPSVAVLPFANRSAKEEDAFFVDGIHDDLLSHISQIGSIKIISRTSVLQYRDTTKTIPQIGMELGVATVLEGGVQRAGEQVRINVQLIDARTDEHLWSQIYDRQLSAANIFTIQSEIATAIAEALQAVLSPEEQDRLQAVPTENLAALEAYFHGKQGMATRVIAKLAQAVDHFQRAIELDPDFALAYVGLADTYRLQANYAGFPHDEMSVKGQTAVDRALQLDPLLGEAHTSLANLKTRSGDYEGAEAAFKRALELNPNYAPTYQWYGEMLIFRTRDRLPYALELSRKAVTLDPLSPIIRNDYAEVLERAGVFDDALAQYKKAVEIDPGFAVAHRRKGDLYANAYGRLDKAISSYQRSNYVEPDNGRTLANLSLLCLNLGAEQQADLSAHRSQELMPNAYRPNFGLAMLELYRGQEARALEYASKALAIYPRSSIMHAFLRNHDLKKGHYAKALARYEKSFPKLLNESEPGVNERNYKEAVDLALVVLKTGKQERAKKLLDRSFAVINTLPRLGLFGYGVLDAKIYALRGEKEKALAALREAIDGGWRKYWWYYLEHDQNLDSIRDEPEFQAMVEEIEADMAEQLARVRDWEANGELLPTPESLEQSL